MKLMRPAILFVLLGVGLGIGAPYFAVAQPRLFFPGPGPGRILAPRGPAGLVRAPVVTGPGFPLRRAARPVIVRPPQGEVRRRVAPRLFLPPVVFGGGVVVVERHGRGHDRGYSRDSLVWQDSETLYHEDDWTEFTLDCDARGTKLWFEVTEGRIQVDWAEVVFENGEVQVVDFPERSIGRGIYQLLDFRDGRRVDSVRMVALAASREAKLPLWMEQ